MHIAENGPGTRPLLVVNLEHYAPRKNDHLAHHGPDLSFRPFGILPTPLSIYG